MKPHVTLDRTFLAVEVDDVVHVLLELEAPAAPATGERAPLDVVAVIDRSGSMDGEPLESVKHAVALLARLLGPDDRLAVLAFDDEVRLVLALDHHDPDAAAAVIGRVTSGGSTNLSGGMLKGIEVLQAGGRAEARKRVIVLTDGHANVGIVDSARLAALAGATRDRFTTSCIGFGDGYDETLLAAIADAGAGNDYWCKGPDQAAKVFADKFAGLASVVVQNISVEIRPTGDAVSEVAVLNEFPVTPVPGGLQVAIGDAYGGERRKVVAALSVPGRAELGPCTVAELVVRWVSVVGQVELHTVTIPVEVNIVSRPDAAAAPVSTAVTEEVTVLKVARARRFAHEAAQHGDYGAASASLLVAADTIRSAPAAAAVALEADLAELESDAQRLSRQEWVAADSKRLFSTQRGTNRGRKARYDDEDR